MKPLLGKRSGFLFFFYAEQVIGRYLKKPAERHNIVNAGLAFTALNIGKLPLGHTHSLAQLCLVKVAVFP